MNKMIKKLRKNKQGKIFVLLAVIISTLALVFLILIASDLDSASEKVLGSHQKAMINSYNVRDSILLYLDEAALLAKKETFQSELGENAGYFETTDVGSQSYDVTGFGKYVYPMISNSSGNLADFSYEEEYSKSFRKNLLKYTKQNNYLDDKYFSALTIGKRINGTAEAPQVEVLITSAQVLDARFLDSSLMNTEISNDNANTIVNRIKDIPRDHAVFNLGSGYCSKFIDDLLDYAYESTTHDVDCLPNNAWDVAACYLAEHKNRVVYSGPSLKYQDLISQENLIKPGDLLFTTSTAWGKAAGYNCDDECWDNYCEPDSISDPEVMFPTTCIFNDETNSNNNLYYENYPIVTHIFMYLGKENNKHIIANLFNDPYVNQQLQDFLIKSGNAIAGVRIIVRPDYT